MKIAFALPLVASAAAAAICVPRQAAALGPIGIEVGAKIGAGTNPTGDSINPLGFGVGARGGVTLFGIYAGVNYMYYLGGSADISDSTTKRSAKAMMYGFEGGYDFNILGLVTLRPQLGVGAYNPKYDPPQPAPGEPNYSGADKNLYLEPGVTLIIPLGFWYVGADANLLFLPGESGSTVGFTFHGQIGLKL